MGYKLITIGPQVDQNGP